MSYGFFDLVDTCSRSGGRDCVPGSFQSLASLAAAGWRHRTFRNGSLGLGASMAREHGRLADPGPTGQGLPRLLQRVVFPMPVRRGALFYATAPAVEPGLVRLFAILPGHDDLGRYFPSFGTHVGRNGGYHTRHGAHDLL